MKTVKKVKKITPALICLFLFFNPIFSQETSQETYLKELEEAFAAKLKLGKAINGLPKETGDSSDKVTPLIIEEIKKIKDPAFDLLVTNAFTTKEEVKESLVELQDALDEFSDFLTKEVPEEKPKPMVTTPQVPSEIPSMPIPPGPGELPQPAPPAPPTIEPMPITPATIPPAPPIVEPMLVPPAPEDIEDIPGLPEIEELPTPMEPMPMPIEPMLTPPESGGPISTEMFPPPPPGPIPPPA